MQHRLKEVIEDPQLLVALIERRGIEAAIADVSADEGVVLLFNEAVVVLVVGPAAAR